MIPQPTIDSVLAAANIAEVIGDVVTLKKKGVNYTGCCPFHDEKTPSFVVSPVKDIFKCFGCGEAGNVVGFMMKFHNVSYPEAIRQLARRYNIDVVEENQSPEQIRAAQKADSIRAAMGYAQKHYEAMLWSEPGKAALEYLTGERGLTEETIKLFGLGLAPFNTPLFEGFKMSLADSYKATGADTLYLIEAGLCKENEGNLYDSFRGRIIIPIHDHIGRLCGFGARIQEEHQDGKQAKYLNTPEIPGVYNKSAILFGLNFAKKEIFKTKECILVEGYLDVISMQAAGVINTVASCGTSVTEGQLELIKKFAETIVPFMDGDKAGQASIAKLLEPACKIDLNIKIPVLPEPEIPDTDLELSDDGIKLTPNTEHPIPPPDDADTFIRREGQKGFLELARENFIIWYCRYKDFDELEIEKRAALVEELLAMIDLRSGDMLKEYYCKELGERAGFAKGTIITKLKKIQALKMSRATENKDSKNKNDSLFWYFSDNDMPIIDNLKYLVWLKSRGFYRLSLNEGNEAQLIMVQANIIRQVTTHLIKTHVLDFLIDKDVVVFNKMTTNLKSLFGEDFLNILREMDEMPMQADDEKTCYINFKDTCVEITAEQVQKIDYEKAGFYLWSSNIIDNELGELKPESAEESDFTIFIQRAITGKKTTEEWEDDDEARYHSALTTIGYLVHRFKEPDTAKAVLAVDGKVNYDKKSMNGRTGKGLLGKMLEQIIKTKVIDGKIFNIRDTHAFSGVTLETRLVHFEDVKGNFDFENLFNMVTGDFTVNPKNRPSFTIPNALSPKIYISSNGTFKGNSDSFNDRQIVLEFSNYYSSSHKPRNEFDKSFFSNKWTPLDWSAFYNFVIKCVQLYLKQGLLPFPQKNYALRQLIDAMPAEVIDFFDGHLTADHTDGGNKFLLNGEDGLHLKLKCAEEDQKELKMNAFTSYLKKYADYKGWVINAHLPHGKRDKSGNNVYMTFTESHQAEGDKPKTPEFGEIKKLGESEIKDEIF